MCTLHPSVPLGLGAIDTACWRVPIIPAYLLIKQPSYTVKGTQDKGGEKATWKDSERWGCTGTQSERQLVRQEK